MAHPVSSWTVAGLRMSVALFQAWLVAVARRSRMVPSESGEVLAKDILADRIELEPVGSGRQRRYKFRGALSLEKLIAGEAMNNTSDYGGPNGKCP
jgi:hypothetical protein